MTLFGLIQIHQHCRAACCHRMVEVETAGFSKTLTNLYQTAQSHTSQKARNIIQFLTHTNTNLASCSSAILRAFDNGIFLSSFTDIIPSKYLGMVKRVEPTVTGEMSTITNFSTSSGWNNNYLQFTKWTHTVSYHYILS